MLFQFIFVYLIKLTAILIYKSLYNAIAAFAAFYYTLIGIPVTISADIRLLMYLSNNLTLSFNFPD